MPRHLDRGRTFTLLVLAAVSLTFGGQAIAQAPRQKPQARESAIAPVPPQDSELYCKNIAEAASDARIKWQTWKLISLEASLRGTVTYLYLTITVGGRGKKCLEKDARRSGRYAGLGIRRNRSSGEHGALAPVRKGA